MNSPPLEVVVLLVVLGVPMVAGVVFLLMGKLSGWARLAENYRSSDEMPSTRFRFQTAHLRGWANYGNCMTFGLDHRGLHLAAFGPLLGHPSLLIPWTDVSVTPKKVWWVKCAEFRFRRAPEIPVLISARLADQLTTAAGASVAARASS